jgi:hypothetical protein
VKKATGTYFEVVPKTVIEKILAQQVQSLDNELIRTAGSGKRAATKPQTSPQRRPGRATRNVER